MKVSLKNYQIRELFLAIRALDGKQEIAKDKDGNAIGIITTHYQFPDYKLVYNLAKTKNSINQQLANFEETEKRIQHDYAQTDDDERKAQLDASYRKLMREEEQDVDVFEVPLNCFDKLSLPPGVLAGLAPVIKE